MLELIKQNKIHSIFNVVDGVIFKNEINDPVHDYITSGNYYEWYYTIANTLQPTTILEIGVRFGYSLYSMMCGAKETINRVVGMDNNSYIYDSTEYAKYHCNLIKENVVDIKNVDSQSIQQLDEFFDLVHIDGDHSRNGKLHDLELIKHNCRYCIIDDYDSMEIVRDVVNEFIYNNSDMIKDSLYINSCRGTMILEFKL